jgi:hypothetical protein
MKESLRRRIRKRAGQRCEYCGLPEEFTDAPFQVDHVIAAKHRGKDDEGNLVWSCFFCNSFKGPNIAGWDDETDAVTRLFNPRHDDWQEHFEWSGVRLEGLTPIGRVTVDVLRMNDALAVATREMLLELGVPLR